MSKRGKIETALLGCMLVNNAAYDRVVGIVRPRHFSNSINRRTFAIVGLLLQEDKEATPVTMKSEFSEDDGTEVEVAAYLARLAAEAAPLAQAAPLARRMLALADVPDRDVELIEDAIYDVSREIESLNETLHRFVELFEECIGHFYGDPNKPGFIRTSTVE